VARSQEEEWEKVLGAPSMREVRERLAQLDARLVDLHLIGKKLGDRFKKSYPNAPIYLVKHVGRGLGEYRWRRSSAKVWRDPTKRRANITLDLTSEQGKVLLESVPLAVRQDWLRWEAWRVDLNLALSVCSYEHYRLRDYADRKRLIRVMEREWNEMPK